MQDDLPKETDETPTTSEEAKVVEEDKIPRRGATLSLAKKLELEEEERGEKEDVEECPKELEKTEDIPEESPINEGNSSTNKEIATGECKFQNQTTLLPDGVLNDHGELMVSKMANFG